MNKVGSYISLSNILIKDVLKNEPKIDKDLYEKLTAQIAKRLKELEEQIYHSQT